LQALREYGGINVDDAVLKAADLRLAGGEAASQGDLEVAEYLFTEVSASACLQPA
jgi:hypothetical protein